MKGVRCSAKAAYLRPVFKTFIDNLDAIRAVEFGDLIYIYSEGVTLSVFDGACWQNGMVALTGCGGRAGAVEQPREGQFDLWIRPTPGKNAIGIEARQFWIRPGDCLDTIKQHLEANEKDIAISAFAEIQASLTFFTPALPVGTNRETVLEMFKWLHDEVILFGIDAVAWWAPDEMMDMNRDGECCPGLLAVYRIVHEKGRTFINTSERLGGVRWRPFHFE